MDDVKKDAHVKSVERALLLVEALAEEPHEHSLTALSKVLGWPKSTVHGLLATLVQYRYAQQSEENGKYLCLSSKKVSKRAPKR